MNSISYLTHRADGVLRSRLHRDDQQLNDYDDGRTYDSIDRNATESDNDDDDDENMGGLNADDENAVGSEEEKEEANSNVESEIPRKRSSIGYIVDFITFIPRWVFFKPILFVWFIITFPLHLLERKLEADKVETESNMVLIDGEDIKEPQEPPTQVRDPSSYTSSKLSNTTIFEIEEEEEEEPHLLVDKSNSIGLKSPTSPASLSLLLSPEDINSKQQSSSNSIGPTSRSTNQRSFLSFPKTVFPVSLINSPLKKTLILDLDETLIHSISRGTRLSVGSGHMVEVRLQNQVPTLYYVYKRPYCDLFLKQVSKWFELVIFTASVKEYADPVIDWLESERKYFKNRYYRNNCTLRKGQGYIKDLTTVDKNLNNLIIVDNSPISYALHENNAIVVEGWINDPSDADLLHLIPLLSSLRYTTDVRTVLSLKNGAAAFEKG